MKFKVVVIISLGIPIGIFSNADNENKFAKSVEKICSIYGAIKKDSCEKIATDVLKKFDLENFADAESLKESCIFRCENAKSQLQMSKGAK